MRKVLFSVMFVLLLAVQAQGESLQVVAEEWPPYSWKADGQMVGVVVDIVRETLDRAGMDFIIEEYPFARAYSMTQSQPDVLICALCRLPSRESLFKWIKIDGLSINMSLYSPKFRRDIKLESLEDAKRYRVGVTRETSTHHFLLSKGFKENVNLFPVNSEEQNALKSQSENMRIDLTTGDRLSLARCLSVADLPPDYWVEQIPLFQEDLYMAFGQSTSDEVVEKVRAAFAELKSEGRIDAIIEEHHNKYR